VHLATRQIQREEMKGMEVEADAERRSENTGNGAAQTETWG